MKVYIDKTERWPDYVLSATTAYYDKSFNLYDIPEELYTRFLKVQAEYEAVSDEITDIIDP